VSASKRVMHHGSVAVVLASLVALAPAVPAHAATAFTVDDASDAPDSVVGDGACASAQGRCTLRAAVQEADKAAGGAEVNLPKGLGPFKLTIPSGAEADPASGDRIDGAAGDLDISGTVTVTGAGTTESVIDGGGAVRVFDVHNGGTLNLKGVDLVNGKADYDGATGHIHGGAIHNHGTLHVANTAINDSASAQGWGGGGMTNAGGATATLDSVTVARNSSPLAGGGIENLGTMSITNATVTDNRAPAFKGGGIWASGIANVTNSIVAQNNFGGDCSTDNSAIRSLGHNLEGDGTCVFPQPSDVKGPTGFATGTGPLFYALDANSQAVDAGDPQNCPAQDVRGVARPQDGNGDGTAVCDIGSFEREATAAPPAQPKDPAPPAGDPAPPAPAKDPALSIRDAEVVEGNSGTKQAHFTVSLSSAATQSTTVRVATADGTARAGSDYRSRSATLTFAAGEKSKTFAVQVIGDKRVEPDETYKIKLSSPSGATIADGQAIGRIRNDD
jgi:hypothetical protein